MRATKQKIEAAHVDYYREHGYLIADERIPGLTSNGCGKRRWQFAGAKAKSAV